jgi:predicted nucleic acid-binding protein
MSSQPPFADPTGPEPSEEEMRAAYEEQLKQLRVEDVIVETVVSLLNLGGRKAGLVPGTEDEADAEQVRIAIEGVRALLPLVEVPLGENAAQLREAVAQLQRAYVQLAESTGTPVETGDSEGDDAPATDPDGPGPAQSSGRLWVPGS